MEERFLIYRKYGGVLLAPLYFIYDLRVFFVIRNSGLFNVNWYIKCNPEAFPNGLVPGEHTILGIKITLYSKIRRVLEHPIWHYIRHGAGCGNDPALFFGTTAYLDRYREVKKSGINPFYHFIRYGMAKKYTPCGKVAIDVANLEQIRRECRRKLGVSIISDEIVVDSEIPEIHGVAVHLHLYYPDMTDYFIGLLKNIPMKFDLFISRGYDHVDAERFTEIPNVDKITIKQFPNRGRDIAPLILGFKELSNYEIVCHIHSKKSPHSVTLSNWMNQIANVLLGSPAQVGKIVTLLGNGDKFFYAKNHPDAMPDPATGWSCNYESAGDILTRYTNIDIKELPVVEFPAGCMFWARREALQRLFTLPLSWDDFPEEPIPPDGSIVHAIERLLLILSYDVPGRAWQD
jgi:hypothetical protein